jgi:transcriptional regulator with XRE-family HTH domain
MTTESTGKLTRELGLRLARVRKNAGLSQTELGRRMGMKAPAGGAYVSRVELGRAPWLSLVSIIRYLQACNEPVGAFMLQLGVDGLFGEPEKTPAGIITQAPTAKPPSARERKTEHQRRSRDIVRTLKTEILPLVLPYCTGKHEFKSGANMQAAEEFYKAWKRAQGRADREAALKAEFDRVEKIGVGDGLNPDAMRLVRDAVAKKLGKGR